MGWVPTDRRGCHPETLPSEVDLPQAESELHTLLDMLGLTDVKGHLEQARENHSKGNWAAANSQLRSCFEALFDGIAVLIDSTKAGSLPTSHNRRQFLAGIDPPFFVKERGEWSDDGKDFVNGLFKRLHSGGSHAGLSDEEDSTFRLHMVMIATRYFLHRAKNFASQS